MSYSTGEAALLTVIRTISGFTAANTSRGKWGVLNQGKAAYYVILRNGGWSTEYSSFTNLQTRYRTAVEVWQRYRDDGTTYTDLLGHVNDLKVGIEPERLFNGAAGVIDATVREAGEPTEMWNKGGGPAWLKQEFIVEWLYELEVNFTD